MSEIVFFLEERSAEAALKGLMPRILPPEIACRYVVFKGKQDLEGQLFQRIRGYRVPGARFIVLRDQDSGDCKVIKARLRGKCVEAGRPDAVVRIACRELESWYLADLAAVERAFPETGLRRHQDRVPYNAPDATGTPSRVLRQLVPAYQKVGGSRAIGPHIDPDNTRSQSFVHFIAAVRRLAQP